MINFPEEMEKLKYVLSYLEGYQKSIDQQKNDIDRRVEYSLKHYNSDNPEQFLELTLNTSNQAYLHQKVKDVQRALSKPYFARVDFTPEDERVLQKLYIGKMTMMDEGDKEVLITDWRAPVASLYYEGRIGGASYDCEEGMIRGEITLKRQYIIEAGVLTDVSDIDITTNDEFLQAALGGSKDRRLKDIVSTIQAEQNKIIRAELGRPLVVQGAAGSGKTTIALHRIAYLLYTYEKKLKPKNIMILAPNRFFLSYISEVLPDLGVETTTQTTFEDFALEYIESRIKVNPSVNTLAAAINNKAETNSGGDALTVAGLKGTLAFRTLIERFCTFIIRKTIPVKDSEAGTQSTDDFQIDGFVIINAREIERLILKEYSFLPLEKRIKELKKNLTNALRREKPWILERIDAQYDELKNGIKREMEDCDARRERIIKLLDERDALMKSVTNKSKTAVRSFISRFKLLTPIKYYQLLLRNEKLFSRLSQGLFTPDEAGLIRERSLAADGKAVETEDLAPLMVIKQKLLATDPSEIQHVVIDEAQDFSLFQLSILKDIAQTQSFSILGDLNQGIYSYKGVQSWDDVLAVFSDKPNFLTLEQSYRTTVEIMDMANKVLRHLSVECAPLARPVIRHGDPVEVHTFAKLADIASAVSEKIRQLKNAGYRSVGVICKTSAECTSLGALLKDIEIKIVTGREKDFSGGVLLIPAYHAKGLEFDAVIIANASKEQYTKTELDIKLLYVAMTRALHSLTVYAEGELTELI